MRHKLGCCRKRTLKQENKKLKNDIRIQKIINTKLKKKCATMTETEADPQTELQQGRQRGIDAADDG
jgi:hypothetical protein